MKIEAERDSLSSDKVFAWEDIDREKAHEVIDSLADIAEDADEENLRIRLTSITTKEEDGGDE